MTDYDTTIRILRNLAAYGNSVAATYLHVLMNCPAENRAEVISQITTFINGFQFQVSRVGPTEFKNTSYTLPVDHQPV